VKGFFMQRLSIKRISVRLTVVAAAIAVGLVLALASWQSTSAQSRSGEGVWIGVIDETPRRGVYIGTWTVSGLDFWANGRTEFDEVEGRLVPGACVRVDYRVRANGLRVAEELDTEPASYCRSHGSLNATDRGSSAGMDAEMRERDRNGERSNHGTHNGTRSSDGDRWLYARIDAMPTNGLIGEWTIGGVTYTTSRNTIFLQPEGRFRVGACVDVEFIEGDPRRVIEIETESSYECR
jgi:hypothetical protein